MKNNQEAQYEYIKMLEDIVNGSLIISVDCPKLTAEEKKERILHTNVTLSYDVDAIKEKIENMCMGDK